VVRLRAGDDGEGKKHEGRDGDEPDSGASALGTRLSELIRLYHVYPSRPATDGTFAGDYTTDVPGLIRGLTVPGTTVERRFRGPGPWRDGTLWRIATAGGFAATCIR
jgi:hypothetical protein